MRAAIFCLLFGILPIAGAQMVQGPAIAIAIMGQAVPKLNPQNPLEPSGFPGLPPRQGELPPSRQNADDERQMVIDHGNWTSKGTHIKATGGVHALYKGYDLYGSEMEGDTREQIFTLRGDVKVIGVDAVIVGEVVTVNFRNRTFKAFNADVNMRPSFLGGKTLDDVYFRGGRSEGSQREVWAYDSALTTCPYDGPHFEILSRTTDVRPGKRIILRAVTLRVLNHDILKLPYLSIPLEDRSDRYLPEVGQSQDEGYYIKWRYQIGLKGRYNTLDARLDYFTKLGNGLGGDFNYETAIMRGYLKAYGLIGPTRTFSLDQSHEMMMGSMVLSVQNNFQRQNYLTAPENTLLNSRVSMNFQGRGGASTGLTFYRTSNEATGFRSVTQNFGLTDARSFGSRTRTTVDLTFSDSQSDFGGASASKRSQLDVNLRGSHDWSRATAELEYQRSIPIGDTTNFFGTPDRTPVLTLRSDGNRLFGPRWGEALPMQTELSLGEFGNPTAGLGPDHISRYNFDLALRRPDNGSRRYGMDHDFRYRQGVYSDATAQYVIGYNSAARYSFSDSTAFFLRYNYLKPHGFTPLDFDRTGESNLASADLSFEPLRRIQIGAQTGYDFVQERLMQTAWQTIGTRFAWNPTDSVQLRALSTYDTFDKVWSSTRLDFSWRAGATYFAAGARYDGLRHTWGNVNFYVDGFKAGRLKTSALLAYNGYLKQFEARHFSFTYDLHCAEAIFQIIDNPIGFRPGTQYAFFFRLKAFPFDTPFGLGRRGQSFGVGAGRDGF